MGTHGSYASLSLYIVSCCVNYSFCFLSCCLFVFLYGCFSVQFLCVFIYDITLILSISTIRFVVIDSDYQNKQRLQLGYVGLILLGYQILFTLVLLEHLRVVREGN